MQKTEIRKWIKGLKSARSAEWMKQKSNEICSSLLSDGLWRAAGTVLLYHPLPGEVDTTMLLEKALLMDKRVLLPKVVGEELELRIYTPGSLQPGAYSIMEPTGELFPVDSYHEIDLAVIPGVAFDRHGTRLGRGKGYYDRLLSLSPNAYKIGICFPFQMLEHLPSEPHDILMNEVVSVI
ncbi:MAG: 5-formyltetrahydrofolate cyclo-ligase [Bacteroidaceae bacterium]|nr:5-formyltetrahydrofolate cyclo-ligase [Bacteroidaceae bacterium]